MQIYIEPEMDAALAREAARTGESKAGIIRRLIAAHTRTAKRDPVDELIGRFDGDPGDVDEVAYGR